MPVFFGCLGSLVFCALLTIRLLGPAQNFDAQCPDIMVDLIDAQEENSATAVNAHLFARARPQGPDFIQKLYRQPETRAFVIDFFAEICNSAEIAETILYNADRQTGMKASTGVFFSLTTVLFPAWKFRLFLTLRLTPTTA
jgi:hypothetical protein